MTRACALALAVIAAACVAGPWLAGALGVDGTTIDTMRGATPPSWEHWCGTDTLGRDLLVRILLGGRIALGVAAVATALALVLGVAWGAVAAYAGGWLDGALMRTVDVLYALPATVLVIAAMAATGSRSLALLIALIAATSWLTIARLTRAEIRRALHRDHVLAARALGVPPARLVRRHLLPLAAGPVIAYAAFALPQVMLTEALLSFLGLGVQAPRASWGTLVVEGASQLVVYPWILIAPAAAMAVTVLALNFLGDGLRDRIARDRQSPSPRR